jgi:hypothetical protein
VTTESILDAGPMIASLICVIMRHMPSRQEMADYEAVIKIGFFVGIKSKQGV